MRPLVISHAACAGHAPENTLAGIRTALRLGADAVEIDVQATEDGVPVLMHDLTLDRTTKGRGMVANRSFAEVRALDAGGEPVPTLAEALALAADRVLLVVEIKSPAYAEQSIIDAIREANALGNVMVWSFFQPVLERVRELEPRIPGALLVHPQGLPYWPNHREAALRLGLQGVGLFHLGITEEIARQARRSGLALYAWTADAESDMQRLIELEVDGIVTNYPDRALALLRTQRRS